MKLLAATLALTCLASACASQTGSPTPAPLSAGSAVSPPQETAPTPPPAWQPPAPDENGDDWIRLTSGEWLRGEIEVLRRDSLEFDSEELDTLDLDWSDVAEVRTTRSMTVGLTQSRTATGTLVVRDGQVVVGGDSGGTFARAELLAIVPGTPSEKNYWSGNITLGTTLRKGNSNQSDATADLSILRRTADSRIGLSYLGTASQADSTETSNNHRLDGKYNRFLSRRFYVTPLQFQTYKDKFQNLDLRFTPGAGAGYHLFDRSGFEWDVDGGVAYQFVRYDSVEPGQPTGQESAAIVLSTRIDADLTEKVDLLFEYRLQAAENADIGIDQHSQVSLSVDLIGELDLDVTFIWDRIGNPVADSDGVTPSNDDYRLQVGFGWSF